MEETIFKLEGHNGDYFSLEGCPYQWAPLLTGNLH